MNTSNKDKERERVKPLWKLHLGEFVKAGTPPSGSLRTKRRELLKGILRTPEDPQIWLSFFDFEDEMMSESDQKDESKMGKRRCRKRLLGSAFKMLIESNPKNESVWKIGIRLGQVNWEDSEDDGRGWFQLLEIRCSEYLDLYQEWINLECKAGDQKHALEVVGIAKMSGVDTGALEAWKKQIEEIGSTDGQIVSSKEGDKTMGVQEKISNQTRDETGDTSKRCPMDKDQENACPSKDIASCIHNPEFTSQSLKPAGSTAKSITTSTRFGPPLRVHAASRSEDSMEASGDSRKRKAGVLQGGEDGCTEDGSELLERLPQCSTEMAREAGDRVKAEGAVHNLSKVVSDQGTVEPPCIPQGQHDASTSCKDPKGDVGPDNPIASEKWYEGHVPRGLYTICEEHERSADKADENMALRNSQSDDNGVGEADSSRLSQVKGEPFKNLDLQKNNMGSYHQDESFPRPSKRCRSKIEQDGHNPAHFSKKALCTLTSAKFPKPSYASDMDHYVPKGRPKENEVMVVVRGRTYRKLCLMGKGGSSQVFEVVLKSKLQSGVSRSCVTYALKRCEIGSSHTDIAEGYKAEVKLLSKLREKPGIIKLMDWQIWEEVGVIFMVLEKGEVDLQEHLASQKELWKSFGFKSLNWNFIKMHWAAMLQAVNLIHEERIIHSDLKPANFLLVKGQLKLIDFGIARSLGKDTTAIVRETLIGTVSYMAPEALETALPMNNSQKVSKPSDIWSLGIILYQMVYEKTPFESLSSRKKVAAIVDKNWKINYAPLDDKDCIDVMQRCLTRDPKQRITMKELFCHPFVNLTEHHQAVDSGGELTMPSCAGEERVPGKQDPQAVMGPPKKDRISLMPLSTDKSFRDKGETSSAASTQFHAVGATIDRDSGWLRRTRDREHHGKKS